MLVKHKEQESLVARPLRTKKIRRPQFLCFQQIQGNSLNSNSNNLFHQQQYGKQVF